MKPGGSFRGRFQGRRPRRGRRERGEPGDEERGPKQAHEPITAELLVGWHPVHEALRSGPETIVKIHIAASRSDAKGAEIARLARRAGIPVQRVPGPALVRIAPRGIPHQGIIAEVAPRPFADPEQLLTKVTRSSLFVVLDEIQDPRNLGAILRTAAAVRVDGAFIPLHRSASLGPAAIRASAGGALAVPVARVPSLTGLLQRMGEGGIYRVGLDLRANELYPSIPGDVPIAIVLGGEEKGLRATVREACDKLVRIPVPGPVGSLNVSVAAGIALYEVLRARSGESY